MERGAEELEIEMWTALAWGQGFAAAVKLAGFWGSEPSDACTTRDSDKE
jgi:hypothetical protein